MNIFFYVNLFQCYDMWLMNIIICLQFYFLTRLKLEFFILVCIQLVFDNRKCERKGEKVNFSHLFSHFVLLTSMHFCSCRHLQYVRYNRWAYIFQKPTIAYITACSGLKAANKIFILNFEIKAILWNKIQNSTSKSYWL